MDIASGSDCICRVATGRLTHLVHGLALVSLGFAALTVFRMFGDADVLEVLAWMSGAWGAWIGIIAIKLWTWSRSDAFVGPVDVSTNEADEIGALRALPV